MKMKILSILFAIISCALLFITPVSASGSVELPIDVDERYTDISYIDETNIYGEVVTDEEQQDAKTKKTVYIAVLSILLVVSIIVLIVTVKRAKDDKLLPAKKTSSATKE